MNLDDLGRTIASVQDPAVDGYVAAARRRLGEPPVRRRSRVVTAIAVAAVAAVAVVAVVALRPGDEPSPITFEVGARPGSPLQPIEAPADAQLQLRFSDHTTVLLAGGSRGVVDALTPRGARLRVHTGRAAVSVPPHQGAEWTFDVGPFEVAVIGTRFDVGWDEAAQTFELVMHDGTVNVTGPTIAGRRIVVAGETLRIPLGPPPAAPPSPTEITATTPGPGPAPTLVEPPAAPGGHDAGASRDVPAHVATWQELAAGGDFESALAAVHDRFDDVLATATATELTTLGDAARYAGDLPRAQKAYLTVRRRFAAADAASATFALARLAFQAPDDAMAVHWLEIYLRENPDGTFAREALGRLLEVEIRTGDDGGARTTATRYLDAYPGGPHAKLARSVLGP